VGEVHHLGGTVAHEVRRGVPRADQAQYCCRQVDAPQQPGAELLARGAGVLQHGVVGLGSLCRQRAARAAGVAQSPHGQRRGQGAGDPVPHGVGEGQVQGLAVDAVVEGVAADAGRRLQPRRERERARLAGVGRGEQAALDLGGEGEPGGPLSPLEHVGVPAAGDQHERQQVGGVGYLGRQVLTRLVRQAELQEAQRFAALDDRRQHDPVGVLRRAAVRPLPGGDDVHGLAAHRLAGGPAVQREGRGLFPGAVARPGVGRAARAPDVTDGQVREPDQGTAGDVGDEQGHLGGVDGQGDVAGHGFDRLDGGGVLHAVQDQPSRQRHAENSAAPLGPAPGCRSVVRPARESARSPVLYGSPCAGRLLRRQADAPRSGRGAPAGHGRRRAPAARADAGPGEPPC
jgi:hypothetical protein